MNSFFMEDNIFFDGLVIQIMIIYRCVKWYVFNLMKLYLLIQILLIYVYFYFCYLFLAVCMIYLFDIYIEEFKNW